MSQSYSTIIPDSIIESLLTVIVHDTNAYYGEHGKIPNPIIIHELPESWNKFSFEFPDSLMPKNSIERQEMLSDEKGLYNWYYEFADFNIDTILTKGDKEFIIKQSKLFLKNPWKLKIKDVLYVKNFKSKKYREIYAYTIPVFSIDNKIAIIHKCLYWKSDLYYRYKKINPTKGWLSEQSLIYKRNTDNNWYCIYTGGILDH